jgi:hypothetical protein
MNPSRRIRAMAMVALSITIGVWMVGCTTLSDEKVLLTNLGRTTPQETISDCYITIMGYGGVEIYITNPDGSHLGVSPTSGAIINEIPGADFQNNPDWGYESSRGDSTTGTVKIVVAHIFDPVEGLYNVEVRGTPVSSGGGLSVGARCEKEVENMRMVNIEHDQELPLEYQFTYSPENEELVTELLLVHS